MLETTANRISYTGSGTTGPFSFPYYFLEDNDLTVIKVTIATGAESTLALTTDYTVSGAGEAAGGSVTLVASLSSAYKLVILRDPDVLQSTAYPRNDPFPSATHERVVDKLTMLVQRLKDRMDRSVRLSDGDTSGISVELSGLDAGEVVRVNAAGTALEGALPADMDLALVSAFVETLLDDADASAFLTTLGVSAFAKTLLDDANAAAARITLQLEAVRADIASATTLDLDATTTHSLNVTGTTPTTGMTLADGSYRILRANAAWPITHGASLICPGSASYTCAAGDLIIAIGEPAGVVRIVINPASLVPSVIAQATAEAGTDTTPRLWTAERVAQAIAALGGGLGAYMIHVRDEQASGTQGGSASATTWHTRVLNTSVTNTISGASLASNKVTLPAGTYRVFASAPGYAVDGHRIRIRNATDSATLVLGNSNRSGSALDAVTRAEINGARFTLAAQKDIELHHYCQTASATGGLGKPVSSGDNEIFSELIFWKE